MESSKVARAVKQLRVKDRCAVLLVGHRDVLVVAFVQQLLALLDTLGSCMLRSYFSGGISMHCGGKCGGQREFPYPAPQNCSNIAPRRTKIFPRAFNNASVYATIRHDTVVVRERPRLGWFCCVHNHAFDRVRGIGRGCQPDVDVDGGGVGVGLRASLQLVVVFIPKQESHAVVCSV